MQIKMKRKNEKIKIIYDFGTTSGNLFINVDVKQM
jgi:hypothetical protein